MPTLQAVLLKLAVLLSAAQIALAASTAATYTVYPPDRPTTAQIYAQVPILHTIAACESTGSPDGTPRQFNSDGSILWGISPATNLPVKRDCGELQINTWAHADDLKTLGLDVCGSESDNVYYGYLLYEKYGTSPWTASQSCWDK